VCVCVCVGTYLVVETMFWNVLEVVRNVGLFVL